MNASEPILLNKKTAASLLGISVRTLDELVQCGDVPTVRIGRRVLFLRKSLEAFVRVSVGRRERNIVLCKLPNSG